MILMLIILLLRIVIIKVIKDPEHLFSISYIWNDSQDGVANKDFFNLISFDNSTKWFEQCKNRNYGPDRTIIALAPSGNSIVTAVKATLDADLVPFGLKTKVYESRDEIRQVLEASSYEKDGNAGICFGAALEKSDSTTNQYQLNLIFDDILTEESPNSNIPNQRFPSYDKYIRKPDFKSWEQYKTGGFTYLQNLFANHILKTRTSNTSYISMIHVPVKTSRYNDDSFAEGVTELWNFLVLFLFLAPLYRLVYNTVREKETRIREAMKIMGLTDAPYWLSWMAYYTIINTIQSIGMLILLLKVFVYSNKMIIFIHLWLFGMTMLGYSIFIGAFFRSGRTAAIVA